MIAVAYIRVSTEFQDVETQRKMIIEAAKKDGVNLIRFYEDDGITAAFLDRREGMKEVLLDAEKKLFDVIYLYKLDRAFRNLEEQIFVLNKLKKFGVKYKTIREATPSENASGRFMENIIGSVNQFERELTAERVFDKNRSIAMSGRWHGGPAPFGYIYDKNTKELHLDSERAPVVREIFESYLETESLYETVQRFCHVINPKTGRGLGINTIREMVSNEVYIGKIVWSKRLKRPGQRWATKNADYELFDGLHEPIIDERTFNKVQNVREKNRRDKRKTGRVEYLLTRLLKCAHCGWNMNGFRPENPLYRCPSKYRRGRDFCPGVHRTTHFLDNPIEEAILKNIEQARFNDFTTKLSTIPINEGNLSQLETQLKSVEAKLAKQLVAFENDIIDLDTFKERRAQTLEEKKKIEEIIQSKKETPKVDQGLIFILTQVPVFWSKASTEEKKKILFALVEEIVTDGFVANIKFKDLNLVGWDIAKTVEIPESYKFRKM